MTIATFRSVFSAAILFAAISLTTSCTVDQKAAYETGAQGSKTKKTTVSTESESWKEKRAAAKEEREEARAEAEKQKAKELAEKEAQKAKEEAEEKALAAREAREKAELERKEEEAKAAELAAKQKEKEERKAAKLAAKQKAEEARAARQAADEANDNTSSGGGFSLFGQRNASPKYRGSGHNIYVNRKLIGALNPSNAKIEIDISEQKARVFRTSGGHKDLVIETSVSTGKSGHTTPTGSYRIKEKLVAKRSTRYGRWLNSSGATVRADGDSNYRPSGATSFVGASMPYWMRVTGGIGMHIGYVPDYPASHGCIRVPAEIQPLIYSKVGVGTSVNIHH